MIAAHPPRQRLWPGASTRCDSITSCSLPCRCWKDFVKVVLLRRPRPLKNIDIYRKMERYIEVYTKTQKTIETNGILQKHIGNKENIWNLKNCIEIYRNIENIQNYRQLSKYIQTQTTLNKYSCFTRPLSVRPVVRPVVVRFLSVLCPSVASSV